MRAVILALGGLEIDGRRAGDGLLLGKIKVRLAVVVPGEIFRVYVLQNAVNIHVSVKEEAGVCRVVKALVGRDKLLVAQIGDALGPAAGGKAVAGVGVH